MRLRKSLFFYIFLMVVLIFRMGSETTANISFFLLALIAFLGRKEAIMALAFSWLLTMLSPGIAPDAALGAVGRYAIIFSAAASVFLRYRSSQYQSGQKRIVLLTVALGVFFLVHSLLFSAIPDVSILKAISWTVTVATLFAAWGGLSAGQSEKLTRQLFTGLTLVMVASLPLIALPLGYLRNGHAFQGILSHPQAFGPTMSLLGIWVVLGMLTLSRPPWKIVLFAGTCLALILMSEARTAGFAMVGGIISSIIVTGLLTRESVIKLFPGVRSKRVILVVFSSVFMAIAFAPRLVDRLDTYVSKRAGAESVIVAYDKSRGRLIGRMWENIEKHPMTGIGFGIASNPMEMQVTRDPIFNLPVGASIEKGVLPLAVVEEVGAFGFLFVLLWGWSILRAALRSGGTAVGLLGTIILLNFGESTFFSAGGMGMLSLVLLGWIATREDRERESNSA
jgi:hypothetical protein